MAVAAPTKLSVEAIPWSIVNASSYTPASSYSWDAGDLIVIVAVAVGPLNLSTQPTSVVQNGGGLNFTKAGGLVDAGGDGSLGVWYAHAASAGTDQFDIGYGGTVNNCSWTIFKTSGHDSANPIAQVKTFDSGGVSGTNVSFTFDSAPAADSLIVASTGFGGTSHNGVTCEGTELSDIGFNDGAFNLDSNNQAVEYYMGSEQTPSFTTPNTAVRIGVAIEIRAAAGGPTEVNVAGAQPAPSGSIAQDYGIDTAGNQPASSGSIAQDYVIDLAGNQPEPTGSIAGALSLEADVAGSQPDPSGALSLDYEIDTAGSQGAPSGAIDAQQALGRDVAGDQPSATGDAAVVQHEAVAGSQAAASGAIDGTLITTANVTGNQAAGSGDVTVLFKIDLAGDQPAASGDLDWIAYIGVSGVQPAPSGDVQAGVNVEGNQDPPSGAIAALKYMVDLAGSQLAAEGDVATQYLIAAAGSQPAPAGDVGQVMLIGPAGAQPAPSGALSLVKYLIAVSGNQPAPEGDITQGISRAVSGNQPAPEGDVGAVWFLEIAGDQSAATGTVTVVEIQIGYWSRDIRPVRIRVAAVETERVAAAARARVGAVQTNRVRPWHRRIG